MRPSKPFHQAVYAVLEGVDKLYPHQASDSKGVHPFQGTAT
jgi:hypothetical protein